ncbi:condensation domain-containing protein [Cohnella sp. GCM10027633]|uniref:condensation domain-containing protein n=1 Tax=unclassified Cohnella TaxID=2636738 RepID=UPI003639E5C6
MNNTEMRQTTHQQRLLWRTVTRRPDLPFMNINIHLQLNGAVDPAGFRDALTRLANEQESLRTSFRESDGVLLRQVHAESRIDFDFADIRNESPDRQDEIVRDALDRIYSDPMPLTSALAIRGCMYRLGDKDFRWIATLNHMAADGQSAYLLLVRCADLFNDDHSASTPHNFDRFIEEQNRFLAGPHASKQMTFWRRYLEGFDPSDSPSMPTAPEKLSLHRSQLPQETIRKLAESGDGSLAHAQIVLKAAFVGLLACAFGHDDVGVFSILANRSKEFQTTIGYLANIVIYRTRLDGDPSLQELLALTRASVYQASRHAKLPYLQLFSEIFQEDYDRIPRYFFNLIPMPDHTPSYGQAAVRSVPGANDWIYWNGLEHHAIGLTIYSAMPYFAGIEWRYDSRILRTEDLAKWDAAYLRLVDDLLSDRSYNLSDITLS